MGGSEAEDAGGLSPVKDDNEAAAHFNRLTLPFFKRDNYKIPRKKHDPLPGAGPGKSSSISGRNQGYSSRKDCLCG